QKDFTDKGWFERAFPTEEEKTEFNKRLEEILAGPKVGGFVRYTHDACKKIGGKDRTFRKVVSVESNIIATIDANGQKDFTDKGWFEVVLPPEAKKTTFNKRLKQEMITKTPISQNKQDDKMQ
ncbi:MAG: hypothetical protein LBH47_01785, partial [Christensenellaceae bacterium]|nr:hypothetical protein [Christensenellaceae bacterium]